MEKFYWPHWNVVNADGSLTLKVTWYDEETTHHSDYLTVLPADPNHEFWLWLARVAKVARVLPEAELTGFRSQFAQYKREHSRLALV